MMGLFTYLFFMLVSERTLCPSGFPARSTKALPHNGVGLCFP
jgi:hypothetical protein